MSYRNTPSPAASLTARMALIALPLLTGVITTGLFCPATAAADSIEALAIAPGYSAHSIELGVPYGGAVANHPDATNKLYVSAGNYGEHTLLEVNVDSGTTRTLSPVVGNIGGLAVLNNGDIVFTENMTSYTILRARDIDADGLFFTAGEITELIAPVGVESVFTGAHLAVAPEGNAAAIPAGSVLVQTADGNNASDILVIQNPESASPSYLPAGEPWYTGFTYNGGIGFSKGGDLVIGISEFPVARIRVLVNANQNDRIDAGEAHEFVGPDVLQNSISDLTTTADDHVITAENGGTVRYFQLPEDITATNAITSGVLVETNAIYTSTVHADDPQGHFTPNKAGSATTVYVGGFVSYPAATNLLAIRPDPVSAAAADWQLFDSQ